MQSSAKEVGDVRRHHWPEQAAEKLEKGQVLKGHDFSRADKANELGPALAAEGSFPAN